MEISHAGVERANNQNNLQPPPIVVVGPETTKPVLSSNKWWEKWLNYLKYEGNWLEEMRGALMVVATVITAITFQPIVNPPGGVWQTDEDSGLMWEDNQNITCEAGTSVLACKYHQYEYFTYMICNTVAFTASLCVTFLLISGFPLGNKFCMGLLTFAMCTTLAFLAFAYIIAFFMLVPNKMFWFIYLKKDVSAFFIPYNVEDFFSAINMDAFFMIYCVQFSLMAVIGVVLLIHTIRFLAWLAMKIRQFTLYMQRR